MCKSFFLLVLVISLTLLAFAPPVSADSGDIPRFSELLVRLRPGLSRAQVNQTFASRGLSQVAFDPDLDIRRAVLRSGTDPKAALVSLKADPRVLVAEPNYQIKAAGNRVRRLAMPLLTSAPGPNDPFFVNQWGLQKIRAPLAWAFARGNTVSIAVLDSGIDFTHPDLRGRTVAGFNFIDPGSLPQDGFWHGTHVSGIAAAIQDNHIGIAGTAVNATIMPLKILDDGGNGKLEDLESAIRYAARRHVRVINMSVGTFTDDNRCPQLLQEQVNFAHDRGVLLVAAAGNQAGAVPFFPAACQNVLAVTSSNSEDSLSFFDNTGSWIDLTAPGEDIISTVPGGGYDFGFGTSMSTPFVAAAAAMVSSRNPTMPPDGIERILERSAIRFGWTGHLNTYGWGRLDAANALGGSH